jgi:hypothetical protein
LVKVTASSTRSSNVPQNVLDWNTSNCWHSENISGQWIDLDLNWRCFVIDSIAFLICSTCFPKKWHLSGFDKNGTESVILRNVSDQSLYSDQKPTVVSITNQNPFSRYRIVAEDLNFQNDNYFSLYSIELYGIHLPES